MTFHALSLNQWQLYPDRHTVRSYVERNYQELTRVLKISADSDAAKNKLSLVSILLDKIKAHRAAITKSLKDAASTSCRYDTDFINSEKESHVRLQLCRLYNKIS